MSKATSVARDFEIFVLRVSCVFIWVCAFFLFASMIIIILRGHPEVPFSDILKGVAPFMLLDILCIVIISVFPQIALWLPSMMK